MNLIIYILLTIGIVSVALGVFRSETECPPCPVEYRYIPNYELDNIHSEENRPSKVFSDMFKLSSPWIGGATLGIGKTQVENEARISTWTSK
jgi:hypothetical protein